MTNADVLETAVQIRAGAEPVADRCVVIGVRELLRDAAERMP